MIQALATLKLIYTNTYYYDSEHHLMRYRIPSYVTEKQVKALHAKGLDPDHLVHYEHDDVLKRLKKLSEKWSYEQASNAFIASLWSQPSIYRTVLLAKLISDVMPEHTVKNYPNTNTCQICGIHAGYWNVTHEVFGYYTQSAPLDGDPTGYLIALETLAPLNHNLKPDDFDNWLFRAILTILRQLPPKTPPSKAREALYQTKLFPWAKPHIYQTLLEDLALMGILDTPDYVGMATQFTTYVKRDERPSTNVECQAPLAFWHSSIGINEQNLIKLFGDKDWSNVDLDNRPQPALAVKDTWLYQLSKVKKPVKRIKPSPDAGVGNAEVGDVYTVRIHDGMWVTLFCHEILANENKVRAEFLQGIYPAMPTKEELNLRVQLRDGERSQFKVASIDKTASVKRVVRNQSLIPSDLPEPDRVPYERADHLASTAKYYFQEVYDYYHP